jgi:hypothetical protein
MVNALKCVALAVLIAFLASTIHAQFLPADLSGDVTLRQAPNRELLARFLLTSHLN